MKTFFRLTALLTGVVAMAGLAPAFGGSIITANLPAGTTIVNIDAQHDGSASYNGDLSLWYSPFGNNGGLPQLTLAPGTYTFRVINPADAALTYPALTGAQTSQMFTAWTYNSPWIEDYLVFDSSALSSSSVPQLFDGGSSPSSFGDAASAYNDSVTHGYNTRLRIGPLGRASTTFAATYTLATTTTLVFVIPDPGVYDNGGGVSVVVAPAVLTSDLNVNWFTIDGGGGASADSALTLTGTAGQPDVGTSSDGTLTMQGGFWPLLATAQVANTPVTSSYKVFYSTQSGNPSGNFVGSVNSDGSGNKLVIGTATWPRVSPDAAKILYHPVNNTGNFAQNPLAMFDVVTSNSVTLLENGDYVVGYDWLQGATNVVFDRGCGIYRVATNNLSVTALFVVDCYDDAPSVNPQDGSIIFHNSYQGFMLANSDGSNRRHMNGTIPGDYWPNWSPDAQWIVFNNATGYWKIKLDGTGRTNLWSNIPGATHAQYNGVNFAGPACFSPDGQWVVAGFNLNGTNGIYAIAADGSGTVKPILTTGNATDQTYNFIGGVQSITSELGLNLLVNGGAEAGSTTNWNVGDVSNPGVDSGSFDPGLNPHTGQFDFYGHTGSSGTLSQVVTLLNHAGITAAKIDAGSYLANISFWEQGVFGGNPADDAFVSLTFFNTASNLISSVASPEVDSHNGSWSNYVAQYAIPAGTRYIRYTINFVRHNGSDLDAFVDDNSLTLTETTSAGTPPLLTIIPAGIGQATISWTPATPGFVLQESPALAPVNWSNSASAAQNPVTVSASNMTKFYRLAHP